MHPNFMTSIRNCNKNNHLNPNYQFIYDANCFLLHIYDISVLEKTENFSVINL
jgi:hypothetical protein